MVDVSIIVPVYNTAAYVGKCLDSLLAQTLKSIEVIAVDDGSTDGSGEVLDAYAAKDSRVRVVHKENGGVSAARNLAIGMATGEYLGFVDSDDWVGPRTYEVCVAAAREHNVPLVQFNFCNVVNDEVRPVKTRFNKEGMYTMPGDLDKYNTSWASMCFKVIRRDFFVDHGFEFFSWSYQSEDHALSLMIYSYLDSFWCVKDAFYYRVSRGDSALHTINTQGYMNRVKTFTVLAEELEKRGRGKAFIRLALKEARLNSWKGRFHKFRLGHRI